jgi:putative transposase
MARQDAGGADPSAGRCRTLKLLPRCGRTRRESVGRPKRLLRKLLKKQEHAPHMLITDKLKTYAAAKCEIMPGVEYRQHEGLNNRAENSHQPTRPREWIMKRFKSPRHVQRLLSIHDQIANAFTRHPDQDTAAEFQSARNQAFTS